jgi:hypothetical protein
VRSQNDDDTTAIATSDQPPRKPRRGPLPARLAGMDPKASPRIKLVETDEATAARPTAKKLPTTARTKAAEAARPPATKGVREHVWPGPRGPPTGPLGLFLQFADLKAANLVVSYCGLTTLIKHHNFPPGRYLGRSTRVWTVEEVKAWLADRPIDRPPPLEDEEGCGTRSTI